MPKVYLGLGSNVDAVNNLRFALNRLTALFDSVEVSPVYESEPVGFEGNNFINLVVGMRSLLPLQELVMQLREIESQAGRDRSLPKFGPRSLDIDILTYDDYVGNFDGIELPRDDILTSAFVLLPLSELAPQVTHPQARQSYSDLWERYDKSQQKLWLIETI